MEGNVERWRELCELAAKEQDSNRLMKLTEEVVRLIDEQRNARTTPRIDPPTSLRG
jgi:hypothetical protein